MRAEIIRKKMQKTVLKQGVQITTKRFGCNGTDLKKFDFVPDLTCYRLRDKKLIAGAPRLVV